MSLINITQEAKRAEKRQALFLIVAHGSLEQDAIVQPLEISLNSRAARGRVP